MKKQQKCYIYTRVSTAIQVDGYSLDAQRDKLITILVTGTVKGCNDSAE